MNILVGVMILGLAAIVSLAVAGGEGVPGDTSCSLTVIGLGAVVILLIALVVVR